MLEPHPNMFLMIFDADATPFRWIFPGCSSDVSDQGRILTIEQKPFTRALCLGEMYSKLFVSLNFKVDSLKALSRQKLDTKSEFVI